MPFATRAGASRQPVAAGDVLHTKTMPPVHKLVCHEKHDKQISIQLHLDDASIKTDWADETDESKKSSISKCARRKR